MVGTAQSAILSDRSVFFGTIISTKSVEIMVFFHVGIAEALFLPVLVSDPATKGGLRHATRCYTGKCQEPGRRPQLR
jgi:hypothetical protein